MTLSYYVSDTKVADDEISAISADKFAAFAVADEEGNVTTAYPAAEGNYTVTTAVGGGVDEVSYIYIKAKINNLNSQADLVGSFEWDLTAAS